MHIRLPFLVDRSAVRPMTLLMFCSLMPFVAAVAVAATSAGTGKDGEANKSATAPNTAAGSLQHDGDYWPGWLGPDRDGRVADFVPPAAWPRNLTRKWQTDVGSGYGSPLVVDDRIYQHARQDEDEVLWCLDRASGKVNWRQHNAVPFRIGGGGEKHGKGPKSSPVYADGRVFTMSITGDLSAWDAESGTLLWRSDYGSRFKVNQPYWGVSTSPIVDGNHVIAHFGNDDIGVLVALNVEDGTEVWSHGNDGTSYSSPLVVEIDGVRQVVEWNHRALVSVDSQTGRFLWEFPFPHEGSNQNMPTPTLFRGLILLGGENRGIRGIEPRFKDGLWTVRERWYQKDVALDMSTAVINGDLLFGFSHYRSGQLFCLDPMTGKVLWQGPGRTGENVMFLSLTNYIVALVNNGQLQIIKAVGDGPESVASYKVADNETWAPPVLLDDGFLVKDLHTLTFWAFPD